MNTTQLTCANCNTPASELVYYTRWCGCWRNCTHGICEKCDTWKDYKKPGATMIALTISEPYASLIAKGEKFVENRRWPTRFRGRFAIHAGKGTQYLTNKELQNYPHAGCVIAYADLLECYPRDYIIDMAKLRPNELAGESGYSWRFLADHEHTEGPYCFVLGNIEPLAEPLPARGAQGFWSWSETESPC